MQATRTAEQAYAEDIFFGQVVIIWARWFLILAGVVLVLWSFNDPQQLVLVILPVIALVAMNFYLHGRYILQQPANQALLLITSLLDMVIITAIVLLWPYQEQTQGVQNPLQNPFFVFYYPALVAVAFVFPRRTALLITLVTLAAYAVVCFAVPQSQELLKLDAESQKILLQRLITMAAMGVIGTYYWRIMRDRRAVQEKNTK
ncbi:MAG: hypothetical protein ACYDBJ_21795 [Aggregatilineales bacterium]